MLDAKEYLHLAVNASVESDHLRAMECLKKCLELESDNAYANYLLGAEYAEVGMLDRAIESMEVAVGLDSELEMATYQLGMLYFQTGNAEQARKQFDLLAKGSEVKCLEPYARGLLFILDGELQQAKSAIQEGQSVDDQGSALQQSMAQMLQAVDQALAGESGTENDAKDGDSDSLYLGAYNDED